MKHNIGDKITSWFTSMGFYKRASRDLCYVEVVQLPEIGKSLTNPPEPRWTSMSDTDDLESMVVTKHINEHTCGCGHREHKLDTIYEKTYDWSLSHKFNQLSFGRYLYGGCACNHD
jgi:hypothetical protein